MDSQLAVQLVEAGADPEELAALAEALRRELLEGDVESVAPVPAGDAPAGSKGLDGAVITALLVQVAGSADAVRSLVTTLRGWLRRGPSRQLGVTITVGEHHLELTSATADQQQQLVEEFVRAVSSQWGGAPPGIGAAGS